MAAIVGVAWVCMPMARADDVQVTVADDNAYDPTLYTDPCNPTTGDKCLHPKDTFIVTFNAAGTYEIHCQFHSTMHMTVIVDPAPTTSTSTSPSTTTTATTRPPGASTTVTAGAPPSVTSTTARPSTTTSTSLPRAQVQLRSSPSSDDLAPWAVAAGALAGATAMAGIVLVRRGRVPFG